MLQIGRIFGIDIKLHWSVYLLLFVFIWSLSEQCAKYSLKYELGATDLCCWILGISGSLIVLFSILFHELAHSLMAKLFGVKISQIVFFVFGGAATSEGGFPTPKSEFAIAIVGPVSSFVLAGIFFGISRIDFGAGTLNLFPFVFFYLALVNGILGAFNLLPLFPMDGGRVFRAFLWAALRNIVRATKFALCVGFVVAVSFPVAGYFIGGIWQALYFLLFTFIVMLMGLREYAAQKKIEAAKKSYN